MVLTDHAEPPDATLATYLQTSLFGSLPLRCRAIHNRFELLDTDSGVAPSAVLFQPGWLQGTDEIFEQLRAEMPWRSVQRPMYDRVVRVPRLICTVEPDRLGAGHPISRITHQLEAALGRSFRSVGLNFYRDGDDSVAWHGDTIGRSGVPATVALVSLGSPRSLLLRPKRGGGSKSSQTTPTTGGTTRRWRLGHGDLLVMTGAAQHDWEHCVPKERSVGPRISLAFRCKEAVEGPHFLRPGVPPLWASHKLQ